MHTINPLTGRRVLKDGKTWQNIFTGGARPNKPTQNCCKKLRTKHFKLNPLRFKKNGWETDDAWYRKKISEYVDVDEDIHDVLNTMFFIQESLEQLDPNGIIHTFSFDQILDDLDDLWNDLDETDRRISHGLEKNFFILMAMGVITEI